jgi:hypothetical protein
VTARDALAHILAELPDDRLAQLLDYAMYLTWHEERRMWQRFGRLQIAKAYGDSEPDYTEADLWKDHTP